MKAGSPAWWPQPTDGWRSTAARCRHVSISTGAGFRTPGMDAAAPFAPPPMLPGMNAVKSFAKAQAAGHRCAAVWFASSGVLLPGAHRRRKTRGRPA